MHLINTLLCVCYPHRSDKSSPREHRGRQTIKLKHVRVIFIFFLSEYFKIETKQNKSCDLKSVFFIIIRNIILEYNIIL